MRWIGSLAVHVVLGVALFALVSRQPHEAPRSAATTVEMVDLAMPRETSPRSEVPRPALVASASGGGGSPSRMRSARSAKRVAVFEDPRGAITFDAGDAGTGTGTGAGTGSGTGRGIGFGDGAAIAQPGETLAPPPPPPPPPPKVSKARPPRLIYPSRQRDVEDGQLFVMKVTVDRDGFVSGARLVRGFGGRRDEVAQDQIWRFRYDPALDDDGSPIAATIEQRFLVQ